MKANRFYFIAITVCITLISGCTVLSFYPLYTEDVLIKDDRIIGKWESCTDVFSKADTLIWEIKFHDTRRIKQFIGKTEVPNKYKYSLFIKKKSSPEINAEFQLHLVELGGLTYFDFYIEEWDLSDYEDSILGLILGFHLVGVHTFAKVEISDNITISWFDSEWFTEKLRENKVRIKHEENNKDILLTAQPKELQKFVMKYSEDENAFDNGVEILLKRE